MDKYPPEAWERLGEALRKRRGQLGYGFRQRGDFARDRGAKLSTKTLARLELAQRDAYPDDTLAAVEVIYRWQPGSAEAVLRGGEPAPFPETPGAPAGPEYDEETLREAMELMDLSETLPEEVRRGFAILGLRMRDAEARRRGDGTERPA
jgi:hypothetical protein